MPRLGRDELRVLVALGQHADAQWRAWPSIGRLAAMTGISRGAVSRAIAALIRAGCLDRDQPGTRTASTVYRLAGSCAGAATVAAPVVRRSCAGAPHVAAPAQPELNQEQPSNSPGAAAAGAHADDGRDGLAARYGAAIVAAARATIDARIAAGQNIRNPAGLLRRMLADGYTPPPEPPAPRRVLVLGTAEHSAAQTKIDRRQAALHEQVYARLRAERAALAAAGKMKK